MAIQLRIRHSLALTILTSSTFLRPIPRLIQRPLSMRLSRIALQQVAQSHSDQKEYLRSFMNHIQLKTPTPPGSQSTNSEPKTSYNLKQLQKQASTIKKLLRQHIESLSSPIKAALGQLIKGCEMAINSGVFLAKEYQDL